MSVLLVLPLLACPTTNSMMAADAGGPLDPLFSRYPSRVLPWPLRANAVQSTGIIVEGESFDRELVGAVVALPNRAVVVYPPADSSGFVIAWAGLDSPWQRLDVPGLTFDQTAVIDAEADDTGAIHLAARTLNPRRLEYFVWKDGAFLSHEQLPLAPTTVPSWQLRCRDVRVGVAPDGTVDLVYREEGRKVMVARRPRGQSRFTPNVALAGNVKNVNGIIEDFGCRNRISYDESGRPVVTTLSELRPVIQGESRAYQQPKDLRTAVLDGKGRWLRDGPRINGDSLKLAGASWRGDFDLARTSEGVVVLAGVGDGDFIRAVTWPTRVAPFELSFRHNGKYIAPPVGWSGMLTRNPCGGLSIASNPPGGMAPWMSEPKDKATPGNQADFLDLNGGVRCPMAREAPLVRKPDEPVLFAAAMQSSHGLHSPYSMILCATDYGVLAVCKGTIGAAMSMWGIDAYPFPPGSVVNTAKVRGSTPANGARDVPIDLQRIVLETEVQGTVEWLVTDPNGLQVPSTATMSGNAVTLTLMTPLEPGRTYRVAPQGAAPIAHDQPEPVVTFTTAGERYGPAPVPLEFSFVCASPSVKQTDGGCQYPEQQLANDARGFIDLPFTEPLADPLLRPVELVALSGPLRVVPTTNTVMGVQGQNVLRMKWLVPLLLETTYRVTFPKENPSAWNEYLPTDVVVTFSTPPRPIELTSATPAAASIVAVDAPLRLVFSKPPTSLLDVSRAASLTVLPAGSSIPVSWVAESATAFRGDHAALLPDTEYVFSVGPISDERQGQTTAVTNRFRTAP